MVKYSTEELMVVTGARKIRDGNNVMVGIGLPMASAILAKKTHAPNANIFLELGVLNPNSSDFGVGLADIKAWQGAELLTSALDVLGMLLHSGKIDVGFLGALEVDELGNINTTQVELERGKIKHFTGSGGGNDIASLAKRIVVVMRHQKRKLRKKVSYITSPGYIDGKERQEAGLRGGDIEIVTDMAVFKFNKKIKKMTISSIHSGVNLDDVVENTGFQFVIPPKVDITPEPTESELKILRDEIPREIYTK